MVASLSLSLEPRTVECQLHVISLAKFKCSWHSTALGYRALERPTIKNSAYLDHDHAPFGDILSSQGWDLPGSVHVPNLKFLASPIIIIIIHHHHLIPFQKQVPKIRRMCR